MCCFFTFGLYYRNYSGISNSEECLIVVLLYTCMDKYIGVMCYMRHVVVVLICCYVRYSTFVVVSGSNIDIHLRNFNFLLKNRVLP